jgi:hypothetical protein
MNHALRVEEQAIEIENGSGFDLLAVNDIAIADFLALPDNVLARSLKRIRDNLERPQGATAG